MRNLSVLLLCCVALRVSAQSENLLDFSVLQEFLGLMVDESGTGFSPSIRGMLPILEAQICPEEETTDDCQPMENWMFGCHCRSAFSKLSNKCKRKPCQAFRAFRDNGAAAINSLKNAESVQEATNVIVDSIVKPVGHALCQCPGLVDSSLSCVENYDGMLFEIAEISRSRFDRLRSSADWKSMRKLMRAFFSEAWCGEADGADCIDELGRVYHGMAVFLDNSFAGNDVCLSGVRLAGKLERYLAAFRDFSAKEYVYAYLDMEKAFFCDSDCAEEIADGLYSCCAKKAMETVRRKSTKKALIKTVESVWGLVFEEKLPNINKLMTVMDLEKFCGKQTDVYGRINDACDALEA